MCCRAFVHVCCGFVCGLCVARFSCHCVCLCCVVALRLFAAHLFACLRVACLFVIVLVCVAVVVCVVVAYLLECFLRLRVDCLLALACVLALSCECFVNKCLRVAGVSCLFVCVFGLLAAAVVRTVAVHFCLWLVGCHCVCVLCVFGVALRMSVAHSRASLLRNFVACHCACLHVVVVHRVCVATVLACCLLVAFFVWYCFCLRGLLYWWCVLRICLRGFMCGCPFVNAFV